MPCFAFARDAVVVTRTFGPVTLDIGYGGAFYAVLPAAELGLDLEASPLGRLVDAAMEIKEAASRSLALTHPDADDLAFLYGTILTDGADDWTEEPTTNICVFADGQVDRSPTGSGVGARLALMHRRSRIGLGQSRRFRSVDGRHLRGPGRPAGADRAASGRDHRGRWRGVLHRRGAFHRGGGRPARLGLPAAPLTV